eukprot:1940510-Rhodomonas_salina.1
MFEGLTDRGGVGGACADIQRRDGLQRKQGPARSGTRISSSTCPPPPNTVHCPLRVCMHACGCARRAALRQRVAHGCARVLTTCVCARADHGCACVHVLTAGVRGRVQIMLKQLPPLLSDLRGEEDF